MTTRLHNRFGYCLTLVAILVCLVAASGVGAGQGARSVILMIGDGMGPAEVTLARLYAGKELVMNSLPVQGALTTRSANNAVTDSAAAATALATGYKTNNGMIAVTPDGKSKATILEAAAQAGKATGIITTTKISHATPACFIAHVDARADETEIVKQALVTQPDLMFGGGKVEFLPTAQGGKRTDGRDMLKEAQALGYQVVTTPQGVATAGPGRLIGVFNSDYMSYEVDRNPAQEPSLAEMTDAALKRLSTDAEGFFLMVEGGRIDNAGHNNDPAGSVHETLAFDAAVEVALAFAQSHPDTLLVVTADHETGGLSVRTDNSQDVLSALNQVTASAETLANLIIANRDSAESLMAAKAGFSELNAAQKMAFRTSKVASVKSIVAAMLSSRAKVSWSSTGHSGVNVPLRAYGVESSLFAGTIDNTEVPKRIAGAMGLKLD